MKNLLLLLLLSPLFTHAAKYYVATTGSDNNPGTITAPFKTWAKLSTVMVAGDTAYIRGGIYRSTQGNGASAHCYLQNLHGNSGSWIIIQNYPGEQPILNLDDIVPSYSDPYGFYIINSSYVHLKGLRITGLAQSQDGVGISRGVGISNSPNCIFELMEVDHIGGSGFNIYDNSNDLLFLNCDSHHNDDRYSSPSPWGGADGFDCTGGVNSTRITYDGCRSYWNSDDGWDNYKTDGIRTWKNCWAFFNGYQPGTFLQAGNGEGFKLGPTNTDQSTVTLRFLQNCVSFNNLDNGFDQNGVPTTLYQLYNNTSFKNGGDGFNFQYFETTALTQTFKNNVAYSNVKLPLRYTGSNTNNTNNTWNNAVTLSNADFQSIDTVGVTGPRQADGSLPYLPFMRLVAGSDLVNAGTPVGLPYNGTAPDMGAYEYAVTANTPPAANANIDQTITLPINSVTLSGSGTDHDGIISAYLWTKISGPTNGTIINASSASTSVTGLVQGVYKFELKVIDNSGASGTDTMQVTVNAALNQKPTANAGPDQNIILPISIATLSGSGTDPDGTISSYQWTLISGPTSGMITNLLSAITTVTALVLGTYKFELKVTDNNGGIGTDTMQLTVNPLINLAPTANAGVDKNITLPTNSVSLSGSGTDPDGTIASYLWTKLSGPTNGTITNTSSASTSVTGLVQGVYQFQLQVTDNNGATNTDVMQVTVNAAANQVPTANAGIDQIITLPTNSITLSGSGTDPDGTIASYLWTKISGPTNGTITNSIAAITSATQLTQGVYKFELRVTDNNGATDTDTMQVTVNPAPNQVPTANASIDQTITLPTNSVTLSGSGTDPDGTIVAYLWTKVSGPASGTITNASSASTSVTGLTQGIYQFQLQVTDNNGGTDTDIMQVTVNAAPNQAPTANAGIDQTITLPTNSVSLSGSGSDPDGTITAYRWRKISGPTVYTITSTTTANTTVTGLTQGVYQFELRVTDNNGATGRDTLQVTVNIAVNIAPIANAGADQIITLPVNSITVSGSGTDPDGTIASYQWTKISGPTGETITNTNAASTTITGLTEGTYLFELKVTDNSGSTDKDTMQVTVNPAPNEPPTAEAGSNQTITLPVNTVTLSGSGTDLDGTISSYQWTKLSGPAGETITNINVASTTVTGLLQGVYQFQLEVIDNAGATATDIMQVNVNSAPPPPNQAPSANAGPDKNITLPTNNTSLNGSGSDPDGTIVSYKWTKISGSGGNISNSTSANANAYNLSQGTYKYELKVTDNNGATARDTMLVIVNPVPNQAPIANAGPDRNITLPTSTASLSGSGNDPDGTIASYLWTKISGPANGTITNANTATTSVTGLAEGIYKFELKVTDNSGAIDTDTMQVTVNPAPNEAPTAEAGPNQTITLPTNTITLSGSGTDPDGTIASYLWTKLSGPTPGTITHSTSAITTVIGLVAGVYQFQVQVTDNDGAIDTDIMQVNVNAANILPTANAGSDQVITLPTNAVSLVGSGVDPDGTISAYIWTKISGPTSGTITNAGLSTASVTGLVQGVYKFQLKVTDNNGATDTDTMQVRVNPAPNQAPTANAGPDQNITLPANNINLSGSGTDPDGTIASYQWTKISGPANGTITNTSSASTSVTGLTEGVYQYQLKVIDNNGATAADTIQVTVNPAPNEAPTANAGIDQVIQLPTNSVTLTGSGTDPDGTIASYLWTKISGPASGTITNASSASTSVTGLVQGVYTFELKVTDNDGATDTNTMQVTVNAANILPVANAGPDQNITLPTNSVSLSGSGTDPDGTITSYQWTKISGPASGTITNASSASTSVTGLVQGVYKFELKVTDNSGATDTNIMQVTVNPAPNQTPTANAGLDLNITLPANNVTLSGSGTDPDGTIINYKWTKVSGPTNGTITNSNAAITSFTGLVQGVYKLQLKVTDNNGATDTDTMQVTVNAANILPIANAGLDQNITLPTNSASLNGSGTDPDGTITSYLWTKISGPASGTITNAASATTSVTGLTLGTYKFQLKVTDNSGATDTDTMQVIVNTALNQPPTANAGSDLNITLPANSVSLSGSGTDPDGTIASYLWTKISGPANGTITNTSSATSSMTGLVQGIYKLQLKVTDNNGTTDTDTMQIAVNAANILPVANAGLDQNITLPTNSASLNGSGTDPDGTIASYLWTKISGPASGIITNAASATTSVTGLTLGTYKFQLKVTDNSGATDTDTMQVIVNAALNQPPFANAGLDLNITLPTNSVSLSGSGTDPDGNITSYLWTKISGPTNGAITNSTSATTSMTGLAQGVYKLQLKVTDNSGATDTDTMQITVNPAASAPNQLPTANAGLDQNMTLPTNSVNLSGSGTDPDGTIASYLWTKISGPTNGTITNSASATTSFTGLVQGVYKLQLKVTDNNGATDTDTMQITVNAALNQLPTANAGSDLNITLPINSVNLAGSGTDPDGTIASYLWTKISGPTNGTITNSVSATTSFTGLVQGVYQLQLKVTDNNGATDTDTMQVTVHPAASAPNQAPTANAGADQSIILPVNSVSLSGSGTDPDGTITSYLWTKISGPANGTITNSASATTSFTGLVEGVYQLQLKVTDNNGATDTDTMQVTVNAVIPVPNIAPTANAGIDQDITLPTNSADLTGSGTDPDGTIASYNWIQISGPSNAVITNASSATTTVTGLVEGVYLFELTVTDNDGATAVDIMQVAVNAAIPVPNIAPTAEAGSDINIYLPDNSINLFGNGSDPDGTIVTYSWAIISGGSYILDNANNSIANLSGLQQGIYEAELTVTDNDGAVGKDTLKITVGASRLQIDKDDVIIMGNPVQNILTAKINSTFVNRTIKILLYDMHGAILFTRVFTLNQNIQLEQINMSGFSRGTYVLKVYFDNKTPVTNKVIKM